MDIEQITSDRQKRCRYWRERDVYSDFTYRDAIADSATRHGGLRLIFHSRRSVNDATIAEMNEMAERVAAGFHAIGLRQGDRLAVVQPSWQQTTLAYLAGFKLGLVIVPGILI